ncbi:hypothetical protein FCM35_KLT03504 [Carex littledalei]|uniref:Uncharacterized protein n=1 Tax=Carex littledalei TaxID=544730 RepID=A0A833VRE3_9POAL|nr:hypothetical protein FCM35_KLT03504 [Carex littledalei]
MVCGFLGAIETAGIWYAVFSARSKPPGESLRARTIYNCFDLSGSSSRASLSLLRRSRASLFLRLLNFTGTRQRFVRELSLIVPTILWAATLHFFREKFCLPREKAIWPSSPREKGISPAFSLFTPVKIFSTELVLFCDSPAHAALLRNSAPAARLCDSAPAALLRDSAPAALLCDSAPAARLRDSAPAALLRDFTPPLLNKMHTPSKRTARQQTHSNEDSHDESADNTQKSLAKRGYTKMRKIAKMADGKQLDVNVNGYNQFNCQDATTFANYLGTLVRNGEEVPLIYMNWKDVPKYKKNRLWDLVKGTPNH